MVWLYRGIIQHSHHRGIFLEVLLEKHLYLDGHTEIDSTKLDNRKKRVDLLTFKLQIFADSFVRQL